MTQNRKQREAHFLQRFRKVCRDFPGGEVKSSEKPDFLVTDGPTTIGIEVTRFFRKPTGGGELQRLESERRQIVSSAKKLYAARGGPPVRVWVHFEGHTEIAKGARRPIAEALTRVVEAEVSHRPDEVLVVMHGKSGKSSLPLEIERLSIRRHGAWSECAWSPVDVGFILEMNPKNLQAVINKKNDLYQNYRKRCDGVWLLVVADEAGLSSTVDFSQAAKDHVYSSVFDRTFLFFSFEAEVVELRTQVRLSNSASSDLPGPDCSP